MSTLRTSTDNSSLFAKPKWVRQTLSDLDRHEGFRQYAYPDPLSKIGKAYPQSKYGWGKSPARAIVASLGLKEVDGRPWTFGHGFTKGVTTDSSITKQLSIKRLETELHDHVHGLDALLPGWAVGFPLYVQTVVANMAYNMGIARLAKFDTTLKLLNTGRFAQAGTNLRKSLWFKQVGSRAEELVTRLETGSIAKADLVV